MAWILIKTRNGTPRAVNTTAIRCVGQFSDFGDDENQCTIVWNAMNVDAARLLCAHSTSEVYSMILAAERAERQAFADDIEALARRAIRIRDKELV